MPPASDPAGACARVNEKYGLGADEKVMLFVGQQVLQKNLVKLLEAAALYRDSGAKFRLLMVGEGYASEQLKALARERGIDGQVIFTGVILDREELRDIYTRAQLFTFPSLYDNAPLVLREAAAVGCPPCSSRAATRRSPSGRATTVFSARTTPGASPTPWPGFCGR